MFDHLEWWGVLILLAPIVLIMTSVRRLEKRRGSTLYQDLSATQKTFILLQLLPPSLAADYLRSLEVHEQETYLQAGSKIKGTGLLVHESVMKEFFKDLGAKGYDSEGTLQERLTSATLVDPKATLRHLQRIWPRPELPPESV